MDITTSLIVILVLYGVLLFFDNFFKTCAHYPYIKFLEGTGFEIKFFSIKWRTKAFNRLLIRWGNSNLRFFDWWFTAGLYCTLWFLPIAIILMLYSVFQNFLTTRDQQILIEPVVPGVNLPASELGYYSCSLIVCSIIHELGHALAAVLDDVNLLEVGAHVFFVLPVAYVNLATDKLFAVERKKTLRIICAGIWHNLVLSLIAVIIYLLLPSMFSIFFSVNKGVTVSQIGKNSPIFGHKGLVTGDVIYRINDCKVFDEDSWYGCLSRVKKQQAAFCINHDLIRSLDESVPLKHSDNGKLDCCDGAKSENFCFEHLSSNDDDVLELPNHACLPARKVIEESPNICTSSPHSCPINRFCFRPILNNTASIMTITCRNKLVIYLGYPEDVSRSTEISSYIPKLFFTSPFLPDLVTKFTMYLAFISFGLAIVNVLPFVFMDGQYISEIIVDILLKKRIGNKKCKLIVGVVTTLFTLMLLLHCLYFFYNKIFV
ncbi:unnamed protein product [Phyllotreta striolata]|uniref:Membrane-bound transcription factor site-2 protease n=1 Tax=Phyllotreta striolata TaxID=444603 RepID=A0A9N9TJA1_PHYSR|nr:unnamed protein product [Phyllotreta striolata]